jgi:photosystem II stability/assembly factor-like uncharacterized protein
MMRMAKQRWQRIQSPATIFSIARAGQLGWMLGANEGVWKYVDGVCAILSETLRPAAITAVVVSPAFPMHPFALAGAADGIARSTDEGMTWVGATMPQVAQISQLALSPTFNFDGMAFAATLQDGVLCSTDHGASWQAWNYGLLDMETSALAVSPNFMQDETVIVATVRGIFRSTNGGRAWRELAFPSAATPVSSLTFAGGLLVLGSESQGLFYSPDGGNSWAKRPSFKAGQVNAVAASADGRIVAIATTQVVASSVDQGANWTRAEGHIPPGIISLAVADDGALLCGTQEQGFWVYA